jgi:hypothetical protein
LISFTGSMGVMGSCAETDTEKRRTRVSLNNLTPGIRIIYYLHIYWY